MAIDPSKNNVVINPLFQTFNVSDRLGVYITKVGIFFQSKSDTDSVTLSIRDAFKGGLNPNRFDVMASVTLGANEVHVEATNGAVETIIEFDEPVYLVGE